MAEPYKPKAEPTFERKFLICTECGNEVDLKDCCTTGCRNDTVPRDKRKHDSLEWHIYRVARFEPWYQAPPPSLAPQGIPRRPDPSTQQPPPVPQPPPQGT